MKLLSKNVGKTGLENATHLMLIVVYKKKEINQTKMRRDTGNYAQLRRGVVLCLTDISLWKNIYPFSTRIVQ